MLAWVGGDLPLLQGALVEAGPSPSLWTRHWCNATSPLTSGASICLVPVIDIVMEKRAGGTM